MVQARTLPLHPLAIVQRGPVTYLIATAFDYADIRHYAVHCIFAALLTEEPVKRSPDFTLDNYIAQGGRLFGGGENIHLEAHISETRAQIVRETAIAEDMTLEAEGEKWRLGATVADSWQLRWWVLSQGAAMSVLAPEPLRAAIAQELAQALAGYGAQAKV